MIGSANDAKFAKTGRRQGRREKYRNDVWRSAVVPIAALKRHLYEPDRGPMAGGIYLLFSGETVMYVGKSALVRDRLREHHKTMLRGAEGFRAFDSFAFIRCPSAFMDEIEVHYIREARPKWNVVYNRA